ncbi:hypothetical protein ACJIZ3_007991 [Penstemon smallii]|uniref:Cyclin-like domain-containing protein n=1 Tax=Penstemon smallii TaxID=265156 RepID=A0ABD3T8H3_9LAMI
MDSETQSPNLKCKKDESNNNEKNKKFKFCSISDPDPEYVEMLMEKETDSPSNENNSVFKNDGSWLKRTRLDVIKWILDTRARFGFHFRTAYLSLIYFDRYFSRKPINDGELWLVQIISVACLSLATKMEESQVPKLSEYRVNGCEFEGYLVQRTELLVLKTLEWKMSWITPSDFLNYFIYKFCGEVRHKELVNRANVLIFALMEELIVVDQWPSFISAAAVLAAYNCQLTKKLLEIKLNAMSSWGFLEKEHTSICYNLFQSIAKKKSKFKTRKYVISNS